MKLDRQSFGATGYRLITAFQAFVALESSGGMLLILSTAAALAWVNLGPEHYDAVWNSKFIAQLGPLKLPSSLHHWINDALMALFFLVVGLELKREFTTGELRSPRQALLPALAACGGAVVPALIYLVWNGAGPGRDGWGIPMATDIAFALAVVAILGRRVPLGLKVFLTALAIVDDLIAVVVIAVFYTQQLDVPMLLAALGLLLLGVLLNRLRVNRLAPYLLVGAALWYTVFHSGVHATIAGVALAMLIPSRPGIGAAAFVKRVRRLLSGIDPPPPEEEEAAIHSSTLSDVVHALKAGCIQVESPLARLEHALHPWVAWLIIPLFALANAGIALDSAQVAAALASPVTLGIVAGLVLGKQAGIFFVSWLAVRSGLAALPREVSWGQLYGASCLAGIGFTMSIFIAELAFHSASPDLLNQAKAGILAASLFAGVLGWLILRMVAGSRRYV